MSIKYIPSKRAPVKEKLADVSKYEKLKIHSKNLSESFRKSMFPDIGRYLQLVGNDYIELKKYDEGLEYLLRSIPYLRNVNDEESLLKSLELIDLHRSKVKPKKVDEIFDEMIRTDIGRLYYEDVYREPNIVNTAVLKEKAEGFLKIAESYEKSKSRTTKPFDIGLNYYNSAICLMLSGNGEDKATELFQRAYDHIFDDTRFDKFMGVTMAKCCERSDFGLEATEVYINDNLEIIDNEIRKLNSNWDDHRVKRLVSSRIEYNSILSRIRTKLNLEEREFGAAKYEIENSILGWKEIIFMSTMIDMLKLELKDSQNIRRKIIKEIEKF